MVVEPVSLGLPPHHPWLRVERRAQLWAQLRYNRLPERPDLAEEGIELVCLGLGLPPIRRLLWFGSPYRAAYHLISTGAPPPPLALQLAAHCRYRLWPRQSFWRALGPELRRHLGESGSLYPYFPGTGSLIGELDHRLPKLHHHPMFGGRLTSAQWLMFACAEAAGVELPPLLRGILRLAEAGGPFWIGPDRVLLSRQPVSDRTAAYWLDHQKPRRVLLYEDGFSVYEDGWGRRCDPPSLAT